MKKIRRVLKDSKQWRKKHMRFRFGSSTNITDEETENVTFMDEQSIDDAMRRIRDLIHENEPSQMAELDEIKDLVILLTESGNERTVYTHSQAETDTSLLCEAVIHNKMDVLVMLVELGVNVNASFREEDNVEYDLPLHMACSYGRVDFVSYLLHQGADPNKKCILATREPSPKNAFEYAIQLDNLSALEMLLQQPNTITVLPKFLLHEACKTGARNCVKHLLSIYPEQLYQEDDSSITPLGHAFWKDPEIAKMLADSDRDAIVRELKSGETSSDMFMKLCSMPPNAFDRVEGLKFLFDCVGYDIVLKTDEHGQTGLHYLCDVIGQILLPHQVQYYENMLSSIYLLMAVGADVNVKNNYRHTPLMTLLISKYHQTQIAEKSTPHALEINFAFRCRALKLLLQCEASAKDYETRSDEDEIIFISPLQTLLDIYCDLDDSALISCHPHIRNMIECVITNSRTTESAMICEKRGPVLLQLMKIYLTRLPTNEDSNSLDSVIYDMFGDLFADLFQLFLVHNAKICENFNENGRPSNYYKQFIYALMQDVSCVHRTRVAVVKCFALILKCFFKQRKKVDVSGLRPDLSMYTITNEGPDDLASYFSYILSGDIHLQSTTGIMNLLIQSYHVLPREDKKHLKFDLVERLRDSEVSNSLIDLVQSHLECLPE